MDAQAETLLDAALQLGAEQGWDALTLHALARHQGLPLAQIQRHFDGKDALAEALFDRAEQALLAAAERPAWRELCETERLQQALAAWFEPLAPHRPLVRAMLGYKLQPEHVHLQVGGVLRVSRTVQWWREAAALEAGGWRRELSEAALTAIYLGMVWRWLRDESPQQQRSFAWLNRQLLRVAPLLQAS